MDSRALVALTGDPAHEGAARELLWAYADHLAQGLSTLVHLLGTRTLLLHGDVVGGGEALRALIERATRERCLPRLRDEVDVILSGRADDAVLVGAAGLVLSETFALAI
jgi:predicted NBD/HSP70 family sugar kinase